MIKMKWYWYIIIGIVLYSYLQNQTTFMDAPLDNVLATVKELSQSLINNFN